MLCCENLHDEEGSGYFSQLDVPLRALSDSLRERITASVTRRSRRGSSSHKAGGPAQSRLIIGTMSLVGGLVVVASFRGGGKPDDVVG